jgi:hypothetical protein
LGLILSQRNISYSDKLGTGIIFGKRLHLVKKHDTTSFFPKLVIQRTKLNKF